MTTQGYESDSGEQASSTADEVEASSRRSTTDDFDEDSDPGSTTDTDSNHEKKTNLTPKGRKKYVERRMDPAKMNVPSDTETRNLLEDVGEDLDDDYLNLQETENLSTQNGPVEFDSKMFELSEEQLNYYTNCFLYLMQKTQGFASLQGALQGMDRLVLDFFRKSRLDDLALSKIWSLSDVNEDGFLNLGEFITAMHLIILHTKGNVPIPHQLPYSSCPPLTPTRTLIRFEDGILGTVPNNSTDSNSSTKITGECVSSSSGNSQLVSNNNQGRIEPERVVIGSKSPLDFVQPQQATSSSGKHYSLSDDHLNSTQRGVAIAKFSDVPPLLVDGHPMALDAATSSHVLPEFARLFVSTSRGPPPQPPRRDYGTNGSKGHGRSISLDLKTFSALSTDCGRTNSPKDVVDSSNGLVGLSSEFMQEKAVQTAWNTCTTGTQTVDCSENFVAMCMKDLDTNLGVVERCKVLQRINEQLETERATLMQIRLQVQLRVDEAEARLGELDQQKP